ncbi:hypothetical protein DVH05_010280 [Phytophthora capsici]|nr:hypothetical protein DVH05_010280 [Phytophthora capsici]
MTVGTVLIVREDNGEITSAIEYLQALQRYLHDCEIPVAESTRSSSSRKETSKKDKKNKKKSKTQLDVLEEPEMTTSESFEPLTNFATLMLYRFV